MSNPEVHLVVSVEIDADSGEARAADVASGGPWPYSDTPSTWNGREWSDATEEQAEAAEGFVSTRLAIRPEVLAHIPTPEPPPIPVATMRECVNANALACLAEIRGAALAVLANGSPTPAKLLRLAHACEAAAWVDA